MKKLFLLATAIASLIPIPNAIAGTAPCTTFCQKKMTTQRQIQMPPKQEYLYFLRRELASDPATVWLKVTDQSLLKAGNGWCSRIQQKISLNSIYQLIQSDPDLGASPSTIKLHRAIVDGAMWSLCSDQMFKLRSPDAVE